MFLQPAVALCLQTTQPGIVYNQHVLLHLQGVIKLTNAVIQKYPNELVFKSLKAVALQRTGKADEAMQVGEAACSGWVALLAGKRETTCKKLLQGNFTCCSWLNHTQLHLILLHLLQLLV
jgi:hypothetical protein